MNPDRLFLCPAAKRDGLEHSPFFLASVLKNTTDTLPLTLFDLARQDVECQFTRTN